MNKQIFLSYSTDDTEIVTTIRDHLEAEGIACWIAPRDIVPGKDYADQIITAIEHAEVLVLVLSESSNRSTYVRNEVERAVAKGKVIIPFRIHKIQPSRSLEFFISNHQWIEAWELPLIAQMNVLAAAISKHLQRESQHQAETGASALSAVGDMSKRALHNLPHQLTAFVGRQKELAALDELLDQPEVRLVTILGPGGMGKTRLSLAVAERHLTDPRFAHGVYFVALAPLNEAQHMVSTLAEALSFSLQTGGERRTPQQQLLDYLRAKQMLLVFDNFEHLLDGADLVAQILRAAPQIRVLATSRERLRVPGEQLFPLQGLDFSESTLSTEDSASAAIQLFVQSARQVQPGLELGNEELAQVARICQLVGGMPLGIELAASWSEVLSPTEIAAEIEQSLDFLEAERRGGQVHHRSIRAVFDSTWQRLDPTEQNVFMRLVIFRGGFTREAAEQVAGASLRLLSTLAGKSLIQHERARGRYTLHELLRQFGEEKLLAMPQVWNEAHEDHCTYYTSFLHRQETDLKGSRQLAALTEIEVNIENIRLAWQWAVDHQKVEAIDRSLECLHLFYEFKSWFNEGVVALRQAATALQMDEPAGRQGIVYGTVLAREGHMRGRLRGEIQEQLSPEESITLFQKSLTILRRLNAKQETGLILMHLSGSASETGDDALAQQMLREAEAIYVETSDHFNMALLMEQLGTRAKQRGNYEQAKQFYWRGIAISKEHGMLWRLGGTLNVLGEAHRALGEYAEAKEVALAGLAARQAVHDKRGVAFSLYLLGDLAWRLGELEEAKQHSRESLAIFRELGLRWGADFALNNLGNIACTERNYVEARQKFFAILAPRLAAHTLDSDRTADAFTGLATVLAAEGKSIEAIELLHLAIHNQKAWQETRERAAKLLAELSSQAQDQQVQDQMEKPLRRAEVVVAELLREHVNDEYADINADAG